MDNGSRGVRRVLTIVGFAIAVALACVVLVTVWLWWQQERVVFQPPALVVDAPAYAQRVEYPAADGHALFGYVLARTAADSGTVVIAFHGNADMAVWTVPWARELSERAGVIVFLPEYRGYAGIPGPTTYASAAADARGALAFVQRELQPRRIILFGHSLGSAVASELARELQPAGPEALVLQSPFTSAREMAARMLVPPVSWVWTRIARVHYDTRTIVSSLEAPLSVAHGTRDLLVPARMGRQVFRAAKNPRALLLIEGAGHNDVADVGGERYWQWLVDAVREPTDVRR
ncbi:MAG TPA: alpha/beta hydrolase [Gemmatimonadaceae bacterium]|nr:alpha/beta hydrolase [Gemmatimonadaceae bacterium]